MSYQQTTQQLIEEELHVDELDNDDYCFIFDRDGNLKGAILPEVVPFEAPKNIAKLLEILGIADISMLEVDSSLH